LPWRPGRKAGPPGAGQVWTFKAFWPRRATQDRRFSHPGYSTKLIFKRPNGHVQEIQQGQAPKRNTQSLLFKRKRFCRFTVAGVEEIDYKDVDTLRDFIAENGKIIPHA
jgi:hypothetical protein